MSAPKEINLALQGGGAHGAFGWGVLDKLLEDGRVDVDGLCGTSAGAMNAVVYAYGKMRGGNDGARQALHDFWKKNAEAGARYSPVRPLPKWPGFGDFVMPGLDRDVGVAASHWMFESFTRMFSPYQFNPHDVNPLRDVLNAVVDFDQLKLCRCTNLFLAATNVRSGKVRIFRNQDMSIEAVLASAALPFLFKAVEIEGEFYWDGGYMGNPVLYPLFYHTRPRDIVIVHINPIERERVPTTPAEIANRVNEITFNSSLLKELRAVELAQRIVTEGWLKDEHQGRMRHMLIHAIRNDAAMAELSVSSKLSPDWEFLCRLRDRGRVTAQYWLDHHFEDLGERSSVDLKREFLEARP